jgi:hypothetical protein
MGQLCLTHHRLAADWMPFDRYLNNQVGRELLLDGGYGKLADGPEFLVVAYAAILKRQGLPTDSCQPTQPSGSMEEPGERRRHS